MLAYSSRQKKFPQHTVFLTYIVDKKTAGFKRITSVDVVSGVDKTRSGPDHRTGLNAQETTFTDRVLLPFIKAKC